MGKMRRMRGVTWRSVRTDYEPVFRADSCGPRNHVLDGVCLIICGCAKLTNINAKLNCEVSRILDLEMRACSICAFHSVIGKSLQKKLLIRPKF